MRWETGSHLEIIRNNDDIYFFCFFELEKHYEFVSITNLWLTIYLKNENQIWTILDLKFLPNLKFLRWKSAQYDTFSSEETSKIMILPILWLTKSLRPSNFCLSVLAKTYSIFSKYLMIFLDFEWIFDNVVVVIQKYII